MALGGLGVVATACSVATVGDGSPSEATAPPVAVAPTTEDAPFEGPVRALVTETGVTVAVLSETAAGYLVTTPCGNVRQVTSGQPIGEVVVVLDPGHGGEVDTGSIGDNGLLEKDVNIAIALATQAELEQRGVSTVLTRSGDYPVPLANRTSFVDQVGAQILVSIHHNSPTYEASESPGTEVYVQSASADSSRLGGLVWEQVVSVLSEFDIDWSSTNSAGVLNVLNSEGTDAYGILRGTETVTVLAEMGYLSHAAEAELFGTPEYVDAASTALATAIGLYLQTDRPGAGYVSEPRIVNPPAGLSAGQCEETELVALGS